MECDLFRWNRSHSKFSSYERFFSSNRVRFCIGAGIGLILSRECLSHDTTYFRMSARTFEYMLWRGSNICVNVIGGIRTTLSGAYYWYTQVLAHAFARQIDRRNFYGNHYVLLFSGVSSFRPTVIVVYRCVLPWNSSRSSPVGPANSFLLVGKPRGRDFLWTIGNADRFGNRSVSREFCQWWESMC